MATESTQVGALSVTQERRLIGRRVAAGRALRALSQTQLGETSGLSRQAISELEQGIRAIRAEELPRLARALGQPISWFFEDVATGLKLNRRKVHPVETLNGPMVQRQVLRHNPPIPDRGGGGVRGDPKVVPLEEWKKARRERPGHLRGRRPVGGLA